MQIKKWISKKKKESALNNLRKSGKQEHLQVCERMNSLPKGWESILFFTAKPANNLRKRIVK